MNDKQQGGTGATPTRAHTWVRARCSHLGEHICDMEPVETPSFPFPHNLPTAAAEGGETSSASAFCGCYFHFVSGFSPLLGLWAFPFPSNYIITSQHAAGIVGETATASTTMVTSKTLISGVLLINSSGIVLCGMITLKCLITNLYVMMHFNYFGLVQYYWALFPRFLALGLGCTEAVPWMLVSLNYLHGMGEIRF